MDIRDQYLDTEGPPIRKSNLRPSRSRASFEIQQRAKPSISINLDNTVVQTIVPPVDNTFTDDQDRAESIQAFPRLKSMHSISSLASRRAARNMASLDQLSVNSTIDPIVEQSYLYNSAFNNDVAAEGSQENGLDDNVRRDLIERLAQSIYSYPTSLAKQHAYGPKSVVSNEIPDVFTSVNTSGDTSKDLKSHGKNFLILTSAGKPIFSMFGNDKDIIPYMGVINTVVSYFQVNQKAQIRSINLKKTKQAFVFLNKSPILLMAYSRRGESTNQLMAQLDLLYSYLISSINERQLQRLFHNRSNFDLHNYLEVTDFDNLRQICFILCNKLYPDFSINALQCFIMRKTIRSKIHDIIHTELLNESKYIPRGTLLYGLILSHKRDMFKLCSVIRPKGHTLHTVDLQLLFCLITHQFANRDGDQELWLPICFPKFNSNGFLYSYIKYLSRAAPGSPNEDTVLVLISAQKDAFFKLKLFGDKLWNKLQSEKLGDYLIQDRLKFRISDIPAPLVHHFVYKSKKYVQYVMPELEIHTEDEAQLQQYEQKLKTYYEHLHHSAIDDRGVPINKTMLNYIHWETGPGNAQSLNGDGNDGDDDDTTEEFRRERTSMMGLVWITPQFELYLVCNNGVDNKETVLRSAKQIIEWCRKYEARLFIQEGATF